MKPFMLCLLTIAVCSGQDCITGTFSTGTGGGTTGPPDDSARDAPPPISAGPDQTLYDNDLNGWEQVVLNKWDAPNSGAWGELVDLYWLKDHEQYRPTETTLTTRCPMGTHYFELVAVDSEGQETRDGLHVTVTLDPNRVKLYEQFAKLLDGEALRKRATDEFLNSLIRDYVDPLNGLSELALELNLPELAGDFLGVVDLFNMLFTLRTGMDLAALGSCLENAEPAWAWHDPVYQKVLELLTRLQEGRGQEQETLAKYDALAYDAPVDEKDGALSWMYRIIESTGCGGDASNDAALQILSAAKRFLETEKAVILSSLDDGSGEQEPNGTIWQIGKFDNDSLEFSAPAGYYDTYNYDIDANKATTIDMPAIPGILGSAPRPDSIPVARRLNISFTAARAYTDLTLTYARWGSETNEILLDGTLVTAIVGGGEGTLKTFSIPIGALTAGKHALSVVYTGGGTNDGHWIDAMRLASGAGQ